MVESSLTNEIDAVEDSPLLPKGDINLGTLASSGFDYPQVDADYRSTKRTEEQLSRLPSSQVRELTPDEFDRGLPENDNTLINPGGPYKFSPGLDLTPPETHVWSAAWHNNMWGLTVDNIRDNAVSSIPDINYNVIEDIPDEFLNEEDFKYFITARNSAEAQHIAGKLTKEKADRASIEESPWQYAGASFALAFTDPTTWIFQGSTIAKGTYAAWKAASAAFVAKDLAKIALKAGAAGAAQQATLETLKHQTQEMVTVTESAFDVMTTGLISAGLGALIPAGVHAWQMKNLKSELTNVLATGADGPALPIHNKNFTMPGYELVGGMEAQYHGPTAEQTIPKLPPGLKSTLKISPAGRLALSKSNTANFVANDMYILGYKTSANVQANQASALSAMSAIKSYKAAIAGGMHRVNNVFREQFGIIDGPFQGIRTRIANATAKGNILNIDQFSTAVSDVLDTGMDHPNGFVNKAAKIMRDEVMRPAKEQLVKSGIMPEYFLDPKFDNYFTRMWIKPYIARNPDEFKTLLKSWFEETNNYYKSNRAEIDSLNEPVEFLKIELSRLNNELKSQKTGKGYTEFQKTKLAESEKFVAQKAELNTQLKEINSTIKTQKKLQTEFKKAKQLTKEQEAEYKKSFKLLQKLEKEKADIQKKAEEIRKESASARGKKFESVEDLQLRREQVIRELKEGQKKLYDFIPAKYLTPDGHIPSEKLDFQLDTSAEQSMDRLLGNDIDSFMSPVSGMGARSAVDITQIRALTIPLDYKTTMRNPDGTYKTIAARDYLSRDIWKMTDNYAKATASKVVFANMAKARGLADQAELKRNYAEGIINDYRDMRKGKTGKEAEKLDNALKRDLKDLDNTFDLLEEKAGKPTSPMGVGFAKFVDRINQYNAMRLLGSAAASALADPATALMRQGFIKSFGDWLPTMAKKYVSFGMAKGTKAFEANRQVMIDMGFALKTQMGMLQKAMLQETDALIDRPWWRKTAEFSTGTFGNLTGMNQLQNFSEYVGGHLSISRTFRTLANKFEKGVHTEADRIRMRQVGITEEMERVLYDMWLETKKRKYSGSYVSNYDQWNINTPERARAVQEFKNSIIVDVDQSTLQASIADQPMMAHQAGFKLMVQYKGWMLAANNRLLMPLMQKIGHKEYDSILSAMMLMSMGALSYIATSIIKNPTEMPDLSMDKLAREGLDRSGLAGIWTDPFNMLQKAGVIPGGPVSRYQSRGEISTFLGPSVGLPFDLLYNVGQIRKGLAGEIDYSTKQTRQLEQLVPYENLWLWRYGFDQGFQELAVELGATDKRLQ